MKTLEKGKDKVKEICDALRRETLEPAQNDAKRIIQEAEAERDRLLQQARKDADAMIAAARVQVEKERHVYKSSIEQASKQSLEALRQFIEHQLFQPELVEAVDKQMTDPEVVAKLVTALIASLQKDGLDTDLHVLIPKTVAPEKVNALLGKEILSKLKNQSVSIGDLSGGTQVKLVGKKMTLDMSSHALVELLTRYLRDDFRRLFFKA